MNFHVSHVLPTASIVRLFPLIVHSVINLLFLNICFKASAWMNALFIIILLCQLVYLVIQLVKHVQIQVLQVVLLVDPLTLINLIISVLRIVLFNSTLL
jgi:hypothetical protein